MPQFPSTFPVWWIALTAALAFAVSFVVLLAVNGRDPLLNRGECLLLALVVGLSVLAWRYTANIPLLNDDSMPPFSPNDLLSPVVSYVFVGVYAAFRRPPDAAGWERTRVLLTIVSFVVNVFVI
ncbi:MAG: hypothetical protein HY259_02360 [Chloroflexi bacterium]|nr:hypothetical protein [Chloroflexota bacterium]MBI3732286.1 hypothetical protein [Chloroflexota bacterium]